MAFAIFVIVVTLQDFKMESSNRKKTLKYGNRNKAVAEAHVLVCGLPAIDIVKCQNVYGLSFNNLYAKDSNFNACSATITITDDNYANFIDLLDKKKLSLIRFSVDGND